MNSRLRRALGALRQHVKRFGRRGPFSRLAQSWSVEARVDELHRQVAHWKSQSELWRQTADATRRQWEESESQLGSARATVQELEVKIQALEAAEGQGKQRWSELTRKLEDAERQRDEAKRCLETAIHELDRERQTLQMATGQLERRYAEVSSALEAERYRAEADRQPGDGVTMMTESLNEQLQAAQDKAQRAEQRAGEIAAQLRETQRQRDEAYWYLGEAKAAIGELEARLQLAEENAAQAKRGSTDLSTQLYEVERQRDEANWYLGEARAFLQKLEVELEAARQWQARCAELETTLEEAKRQRNEPDQLIGEMANVSERLERELQQVHETTRLAEQRYAGLVKEMEDVARQQNDPKRYLGAAITASIERLEGELRMLKDAARQSEERDAELAAKLQETERYRSEVLRFLESSRAAQATLDQRTQQLTEQLTQVQDHLEDTGSWVENLEKRMALEQANSLALEVELEAIRVQGERRTAPRVSVPDLIVELQGPGGAILFRGRPRNVSASGFGFATERSLEGLPDRLTVRFYPLGQARSIEATGRVVWLVKDNANSCYQVGCELVDVPVDSRDALERILKSSG
jgi:chromosome segregation ATPase